MRGLLRRSSGRAGAADLLLERCRQLAETSRVRSAQFVVSLARAGRTLGEARLVELNDVVSRAIARCDSELSLEREAWRVYYRGSVAHFLGLSAHALGRAPTALAHFREAVAMNRKLNMPAQLARSERHLQQVMKDLGKSP